MRHERIETPSASSTRRISGHAAWLARFAALFLLISVLSHRFNLIDTPDFFWLLAAGGLLALMVPVLAAAALRRAWRYGEAGSGRAARAMVLAVLLLVPYGYAGWLVHLLPAMDDVATDPFDPPGFELLQYLRSGQMNRLDPISPAEARLQTETYPAVTGRRYAAGPDMVELAIRALLDANGWRVQSQRRSDETGPEMTIEATGRSLIFGFPFDISIRTTDEGETTYVDLRSAMRYGAHDLGANARRILSFLSALDLDMATRAGGGSGEGAEPSGGE